MEGGGIWHQVVTLFYVCGIVGRDGGCMAEVHPLFGRDATPAPGPHGGRIWYYSPPLPRLSTNLLVARVPLQRLRLAAPRS